MQTLLVNNRHCPTINREVQVEETYRLAGSGTCQIDMQLTYWQCLSDNSCPAPEDCPLHREYAGAGERSFLDR